MNDCDLLNRKAIMAVIKHYLYKKSFQN